MSTPDKQLSDEQSRQVAETIREEIARRRISRQALAEQAKLSLSTLEKVLGGRRPFTLATTVRLEQALGVSLRKALDAPAPAPAAPANGDVAPDSLGAYSRRARACSLRLRWPLRLTGICSVTSTRWIWGSRARWP